MFLRLNNLPTQSAIGYGEAVERGFGKSLSGGVPITHNGMATQAVLAPTGWYVTAPRRPPTADAPHSVPIRTSFV